MNCFLYILTRDQGELQTIHPFKRANLTTILQIIKQLAKKWRY